MQEQHGKLHAKAEPQQPGKILRWTKATDKMPDRLIDAQYFAKIKKSYVDREYQVLIRPIADAPLYWNCRGQDYSGDCASNEIIEWLEEAEDLSAPASPVEGKDKWIVSGEKTVQVSEDSWRRNTKTLVVADDTPLGKALQWAEDNGLDFEAGLTIRKLHTLPSKI